MIWTELLITDVTAMRDGRICFAGIDKNLQNIRPVSPRHFYREHLLLNSQNEVIRPRSVINLLLRPEPSSTPPHTEDHFWKNSESAEFLREVSPKNWCSILRSISCETVEEIFEISLERNRNIPAGMGSRSLGTLQSPVIEHLTYRGRPDRDHQLRLAFCDRAGSRFDLPITDLNLTSYVKRLNKTIPLEQIAEILTTQFTQANHVWLRLGLTRPFQRWCWVQINAIYTMPDYLNNRYYAHFETE